MIKSHIKIGSKVRIIGRHRHGEVGHITDLNICLFDKEIRTVFVSVHLPIPGSKFFESTVFDIDEVERVEVADVRGQQMKAAA